MAIQNATVLLVVLFAICFYAPTFASNPEDCSLTKTYIENNSLKVLSWNMYMLPKRTFMKTGQELRAHLIVEEILERDFDVIVFQEAFHPQARKIIAKGLGSTYPHQIGPANRSNPIKTNSGIWIVSKTPMKEIGKIKFKKAASADWFARKGVLLVELEINGQKIQIAGTHLQAGGKKAPKIRRSQYIQMQEQLLKPNTKKDVPQLIVGDFNTVINTENYNDLLKTIQAEDGPFIGENQYTSSTPDYGKPRQIIDYAFLKRNNHNSIQLKRKILRLTSPWGLKGEKRSDLSDHFSIEAELFW